MIKQVEEIKIRKDLIHLKDNYGFNNISLAKLLGCNEKIIRDFTNKKTSTLSKKSFENIFLKLLIIKKEIKKAEDYKPFKEGQVAN